MWMKVFAPNRASVPITSQKGRRLRLPALSDWSTVDLTTYELTYNLLDDGLHLVHAIQECGEEISLGSSPSISEAMTAATKHSKGCAVLRAVRV